jgi:hypothetical protein
MTDRSMQAILLDGEGRAPESRRLTLIRETEEAGSAMSAGGGATKPLILAQGGDRPILERPSPAGESLRPSAPAKDGTATSRTVLKRPTAAEPATNRTVLKRPVAEPATHVVTPGLPSGVRPAALGASMGSLPAAPPVHGPGAKLPLGSIPAEPPTGAHGMGGAHVGRVGATAVASPLAPLARAPVIPGVGAAHPGRVGAAVGLVQGLAAHVVHGREHEPMLHEVAARAHKDPARFGSDLILLGHHPRRYHELARLSRLPSHVWTEHEARGQLDEHLRAVHEGQGAELERLYRHRPLGERVLLGLAAASGAHEDVARALDALRAHPRYPARVGLTHLIRGFSPAEIARVGATFLPGAAEVPLATFRAIREAHEERYQERRRRLLRRLREEWATGAPALIPMFHALVRGFSPEQAERLRAEVERDGDIEAVLESVEGENREARMAAVEAAFTRWQAEWEANRNANAQTPMEEPHMKLPEGAFSRADRPKTDGPEGALPSPTAEPAGEMPMGEEPPAEDEREAGAVRGGRGGTRGFSGHGFVGRSFGPRTGRGPWGWSSMVELLPEYDEIVDEDADEDAGVPAIALGVPTKAEPKAGEPVRAAAVQAIRAPSPGAYAADGVLPWKVLTQGLGRWGREELRRAWDQGRVWERYNEILVRRGEETMAAREAEFRQRLAALGCAPPGPCRLAPESLSILADMGETFTPEQWARLAAALTEGAADPLATWRALERENLVEAMSIRGPAFLRWFGSWGRAPRWNPVEWELGVPRLARVALDQETAGFLDDLGGALGTFASSGPSGGEGLGTIGSTIGSLFAQGSGDGSSQALAGLAGLAGKAAQALGGSGGPGQVVGKIGDFARHAVAGLTGRAITPPPHAPPPHAPPSGRAAPDLHAVDLERILLAWGKPESRPSRLAHALLPALVAIGLPKLASVPPRELLHLIPHELPSASTDPSHWWSGLTAMQGIGEQEANALRVVIDKAGPGGTEQVLAAYREALREPLARMKARREEVFTRILRHAQKVAGATGFDPHRLPGGNPFVLFAENAPHEAWKAVEDGISTGHGLDAFRAFEVERERNVLATVANELPHMLAALWQRRDAAPASTEAADPDAGEMREHGEAGASEHKDPEDDWTTLAYIEKHGPGAAPIVAYFRSLGSDAEGFWRGYIANLAPWFRQAGFGVEDAEFGLRDFAGVGVYLAMPGASGPRGWRRATAAEMALFAQEPVSRLGSVLTFWVDPTHGVRVPDGGRGEAGDALGSVLANVFTGGLYGAARFAARGPEIARAEAARENAWDHHGWGDRRRRRIEGWRDHEALEAFRHNPHARRILERGGSVDGMTLRGLRGRGEVSGPEDAGEAGWIRPRPVYQPLYHLTFGRPMTERELARLLTIVPQLRAHPDGVIREMAGLAGQARSVLGVDARTGEYVAETGETLPLIAEKLVGDRSRWRELEAANPGRAEGDPRLRIPPNWFQFVPYAVPVHRLIEEIEQRREEAGAVEDTGALRRHFRGARRAGATRLHGGFAAATGMRPGFAAVAGDDNDSGPDDGDAGAWVWAPFSEREHRLIDHFGLHRVTRDPTLLRWLLLDAVRREAGDAGEAGGLMDWLAEHNPFGSPPAALPPATTPLAVPLDDAPATERDSPVSPARANVMRDGPRQPLTRHTYTVQKGDWPARIADRFAAGRPNRLAELFHANPNKHVSGGNWTSLNTAEVINLPDAWMSDTDARGVDDEAGDALRENTTKRTYAVVRGEGMLDIAKKLGAFPGRPHWFAELRDVNRHKAVEIDPVTRKQVKWTTLNPGEIINIPDEWPDNAQLRLPPGAALSDVPVPGLKQYPKLAGGVTPAPVAPPGTVPAGATVDPGTALRLQGYLIAWRHAHPDAVSPRDFGSGMPVSLDALGALNKRTQEALASFQKWSNATAGTHLRTDGVIDPDTLAAIDSWHAHAVGDLPQRPTPAQVPGAQLPHATDPFASMLGAAGRVANEVAKRVAPPPSAPPGGAPPGGAMPAGTALSGTGAFPDGASSASPVDPFLRVAGAAGELGRKLAGEPRVAREPRESFAVAPPSPPPSLPEPPPRVASGGTPSARASLPVPPEVYRRFASQGPRAEAPPPQPPAKKKGDDDTIAAAGLGVLAALGGLFR